MQCSIVPPYLLARLASLDDPAMAPVAAAARASLAVERPWKGVRAGEKAPPTTSTPRSGVAARRLLDPQRTISDARNGEELPGVVVRSEDGPAGIDLAVTEAFEGLGHTHELFRHAFGRASIDDGNLPLDATVHFGRDYDNAFWDGERMVFGDGDGIVFTRMTRSLSVIGHELAHGVTQYSANLEYRGQSGALNESVSDVFGALVEQRTFGQSASEATWLIGLGLFTDEVEGDALRSLKAPGTAYDDDVLGKDPQPDHMRDYIETEDDNGGVHLNSGIPNLAFSRFALALGGNAWEDAGRVWYSTITGDLSPTATFAQFATATSVAAVRLFGDDSRERSALAEAWDSVGVPLS